MLNLIYMNKYFENRVGIKTRLQNAVNACALAEWRFGADRGYSNVIFLTFETSMKLDSRL